MQVWQARLQPRLPVEEPHQGLWWRPQRCALAASHVLLTLLSSSRPSLRRDQSSRQEPQRHQLRRCSRWALHQLARLSLLRGTVQQQQRCTSLSLLLLQQPEAPWAQCWCHLHLTLGQLQQRVTGSSGSGKMRLTHLCRMGGRGGGQHRQKMLSPLWSSHTRKVIAVRSQRRGSLCMLMAVSTLAATWPHICSGRRGLTRQGSARTQVGRRPCTCR